MESSASAIFILFTTPLYPVFYDLIAIAIIVFFLWRGWRRGLLRELSGITAIVASYLLAEPVGRLTRDFLPLERIPSIFHATVATAAGGLAIYALLRISMPFLIRFFEKKQIGDTTGRITRGTGALIGGVFGVLIIFVFGLYILIIGSFSALSPENRTGKNKNPSLLLIPALSAAAHRESFLESQTGKLTEKINPLNSSSFISTDLGKSIPGSANIGELTENIGAVAEILREPEKIREIMESEEVQNLMQNDAIQSLTGNAEIRQMLETGDVMGLMSNPEVIKAMDDPEVLETIKNMDINNLLNQTGGTVR